MTHSHPLLCMAFFCFIYLNTINTSEMSIQQVEQNADNIYLSAPLLYQPCASPKIITWILCLLCPCYLKAGSSVCHLYTELQQLRSHVESLFTVELAIALHSGSACCCTEPASGSVSFHHAAGQAIFNMYPFLCWRAAAAALLVCEQRRTSGKWGTLMESCNWIQLAQSQIKWVHI